MPLALRDDMSVPTERWQYPAISAARFVEAPNWSALYPSVVKHYQYNNAAVPSLQDVIDWCCANLSISCYDDQTREPLMNRWQQGLPSLIPVRCCGSAK